MSNLIPAQCAVVLVHFNNPADTLTCLLTLERLTSPLAYIVVVDNGSCIEAVQRLRQGWESQCDDLDFAQPQWMAGGEVPTNTSKFGSRIFLSLSDNTGFSGGNNAALHLLLAHTNCKAFWLLNNDAAPSSNALDALCERLNRSPEMGLCGSTLVYAHASEQLQCAGGSCLSPFTGRTRFLHEGATVKSLCTLSVRDVEKNMDFITGASLLVRREVFERIGLMPEEYFLYYEDAALCLAAKKADFALAWAPQSIVYHKEGGSSGATSKRPQQAPQRSRFVDYLSLRNRVFLMRTYYPWALPLVALSYFGVAMNRIRRGQTDRIGLVCKAFWHGLNGRMGKPRAEI